MSYCVNCGVELDASLKECPLCNTPIVNPRQINSLQKPSSFPKEKGKVEKVKRKDFGILLSTMVLSTSIICGLLNLLVFYKNAWSLTIIGACVLIWVILIPVVIYTKQSIYLSILLDGAAIIGYLYLITYITGSKEWFWKLGVPITGLVIFIIEAITICIRKLPKSFLTIALYCLSGVGLFCIGLEVMIDFYLRGEVQLSWSAIVMTVCMIADITIATLLSRKRLRNEVRRRLHF